MVKHLTIDLDDQTHKELSELKAKKEFTWLEVLLDWKKKVEDEGQR